MRAHAEFLLCFGVLVGAQAAMADPPRRPTGHRPSPTEAAESFDFFLVDRECKTLAATLGSAGESAGKDLVANFKSEDGMMGCNRTKKSVECAYSTKSSSKIVSLKYKVTIDTTSLIRLENDTGSDVIFIDPSQSDAITLSRSFDVIERSGPPAEMIPLVVSKYCKSRFLTGDEMKLLMTKTATSPSDDPALADPFGQ